MFFWVLLFIIFPVSLYAQPVFQEDWESGYDNTTKWAENGGCYDYSFQLVPDPCDPNNNTVMKITNIIGDDNGNCPPPPGWKRPCSCTPAKEPCSSTEFFEYRHRAELTTQDTTILRPDIGEDHWVGYRLYISPDFPTNHEFTVTGQTIPPPFSSYDWAVWLHNNGFRIESRNDSSRSWDVTKIDNFPRGEWINIVIHNRRAVDTSGEFEFWLNGTKYVDKQNARTSQSTDDDGWWKISNYMGQCLERTLEGKTQILYFDDIKVAYGADEYATVAPATSPGCTASPSPPEPGSCDDLFNTAPGYIFCEDTGTACKFNAELGGDDCDAMCGSFNKACVAAYDNQGSTCTVITPNTDTCTTVRSTEICECEKEDISPPPTPTPSYGPGLESCVTTQQSGTNGLIIVPDNVASLQDAVENNTNKTILVKSGTYGTTSFNVGAGNIVKPYDCAAVTVDVGNPADKIMSNAGYVVAGLNFDCTDNGKNWCLRMAGNGGTVRNNRVYNAQRGMNITNGDGNLVEGNLFQTPAGDIEISDFVKFTGDIPNTIFRSNHLDYNTDNTFVFGDDGMSIRGVDTGPVLITNNRFNSGYGFEQHIDIKRNTAPVEISYNTFLGPMGGTPLTEPTYGVNIGDGPPLGSATDCHDTESCPNHSLHHNYFYNTYSVNSPQENSRKLAIGIRTGNTRSGSHTSEFNVEHFTVNGTEYDNADYDGASDVTYRRNAMYKGVFKLNGNICTRTHSTAPLFELDTNVYVETRITDQCTNANDWSVTDNVFSNVLGGGIDATNLDTGNSTDVVAYADTSQQTPDFTILGGTHSDNGPLPVPTLSSAQVDNDCKMRVTMSPYNDLYNHGPMSKADASKITKVDYSGSANPTVTLEGIQNNTIIFKLSSCPLSTDTVTFDATHGWCQDSTNIGGDAVQMNARCLARTGEAVTNNVDAGGASTFYVDVTCGTNGDGTTETCGVNGPWKSFFQAIEIAGCSGMVAGDILEIKGDVSKDETCENGGNCYFTGGIDVPASCSGITIQPAENEHVVVNGSSDSTGNTWVSVGSGVYKCTDTDCAGSVGNYPAFTAWYDRGAGEERLDLVQTNQTCDATLAAGFMRIEPATMNLCVHLSDGSNPANATYFRVPSKEVFMDATGAAATDIVVRDNPSGTGSFTISRYAVDGIRLDLSNNPGWEFDNLDMSWMLGTAISVTGGPAQSATIITDNTISFIGETGIRLTGDTGQFDVSGNTVTDIQTEPEFEECEGIGSGCLVGFDDNGSGIRIAARNGAQGIVEKNTILRYGGGMRGEAYGIFLDDYNQGTKVRKNYMAHASGLTLGGYGAYMTCNTSNQIQDENHFINNRIYNVDKGVTLDYGGNCSSQVGRTNYIYNNTIVDPVIYGISAEGAGAQDGTVSVVNNILSAPTTSPTLYFTRGTDTGWARTNYNAFECDGCDAGQDIINHRESFTVERAADCDSGIDCMDDFNGITTNIHNNLEGNLNADTTGDNPALTIDNASAAYDAGQTLPIVTDDYTDTSRPQSVGYDIGAHEVTGVAPAFTVEQQGFRFYAPFEDVGDQPLEAEDTDTSIYTRGRFTLRFSVIAASGDAPSKTLALYARLCNPACGTFTKVTTATDDASGVYLLDHPSRTQGTATTNLLALGGRTFVSGKFIDTSNSATIELSQDHQTEYEFSLGISSAVSEGDTVELRVEESDGTDLDTYTATPTVTIIRARSYGYGGRFE